MPGWRRLRITNSNRRDCANAQSPVRFDPYRHAAPQLRSTLIEDYIGEALMPSSPCGYARLLGREPMMSALARPRHSGFDDVVGDATIEMLASGFGFSKGRCGTLTRKWLVFSDIPESRIYTAPRGGRDRVVARAEPQGHGNTLRPPGTAGHLRARDEPRDPREPDAQHESRCRHAPPGQAAQQPERHRRCHRRIDPNSRSGLRQDGFYGVPRSQELRFPGVYRIDGDGAG